MSSRLMLALLGVLVLAPVAVARASPSSSQESGNPINDQGSSYHYRTYITSVAPRTPGLSVEVLEFADRLLVRNHTGKIVTVYGYSGEPYARLQPGGAAEQNVRSPAVYLNTNFYADVTVPPLASATATPRWEVIDRTGQFEWHDHRIHWMSPVTPPEVKDTAKRTKIFNWTVPIRIGTVPGAIHGELFWVPESDTSIPTAAIVALVLIVLAGIATVLFVRRRRRTGPPTSATGGAQGEPDAHGTQREAW